MIHISQEEELPDYFLLRQIRIELYNIVMHLNCLIPLITRWTLHHSSSAKEIIQLQEQYYYSIAIQYSIVQNSIEQYSIVQYNIVWYSIVQHSTVYGKVQHSTVQQYFYHTIDIVSNNIRSVVIRIASYIHII